MNIDLGTFSWDISKIEKQIIENRKQIEQFSVVLNLNKKALEQDKKELQELGVKSAFINKTQEELNKQFAKGEVALSEYNKQTELNNKGLSELDKASKEIAHNQSVHIKNIIDQENAIKSLREENTELNKLYQAGREELQSNTGVYRELNKELNALKTEAKNLGAELLLLRREGKENTEEYKALENQWKEVSKQADELNDDFKNIDKAVGDNQRSVGDYKDQIVSASSEIMSGFREIISGNISGGIEAISGSFAGLKTAFTSLTTSLLSNPFTAVIVGVGAVATGVGLAVKEFFDYNNQVKELNKEITLLTNHTGEIADEIRVSATAISETYEKDFTEAVKEINALMTDFGISSKEAFDIYNKGMADGGALNDEFGESIREYGVLMAQNGYNAEEFVNLLNAGIDLDIYSDKLPDAIKEAGLSLTEATKATSEALTNAFGQSFSDDILKRVELGQTSVKDALVEISQKAKESNLTLQQQAQLTADVFRGAGEDAGGALKIFEAINLAHQKENEELQGVAKHTAEMTILQKELAEAKDEALKSDNIINFTQNLEKFWIKAQTIWYQFIEAVTEAVKWVDNITGASNIMGETWEVVKDFAGNLWEAINSVVSAFSDLLTTLGLNNKETSSFVKEVFKTLNPLNILKGIISTLSTLIQSFSNYVNTARIGIVTFGNIAKNVFSQVVSIASSIKNLDFTGALDKLKNLSVSKELANAQKEAQGLNKEISKTPKMLEKSDKIDNRSTLADREAQIKAEGDAIKKAEADKKKATSQAEADKKKAIADKQKEIEKAKKEAEAEAKRSLELAREKTQQEIDLAKSELAEYIRINAEKYKDDKRLTDEKIKNQIDYFNEVKRQQLNILDIEEKAKLQSIKNKEDEINKKKNLNANDRSELQNLQNEKYNIEKEYQNKREQTTLETNEKISDTEQKHAEKIAEQRKLSKAIEYQQTLLDLQEQGDKEYEIRKLQLEQETQQKLDNFAKENDLKLEMDNNNYISQQELSEVRKQLENEIKLTDDENEKTRIKNKLDQINLIEQEHAEKSKQIEKAKEEAKLSLMQGAFGQVKSLFGEQTALGKASAIAETTISTYKAAQDAYANAMKIPVIGLKLAPVMAGIAIASGLKNVSNILSVQTPKAQRGMLIKGNSHENGGVPILTPNGMIEAEGGEIIINKRSSSMFRNILSDINHAGGGVKFATGGIIGGNLSNIQNSITTQDNTALVEAVRIAVYEGSIAGTMQGSKNGIQEMSDNQYIIQGSNF